MRKLKGYLRRITDGAGPPPGSVEVHATVRATATELDLEDHDLGTLAIDHLAGSGSATLADDDGMFGWEFELGPGLIDQEVIGSDPQTEVHWRFPDESSQIGAAYHSDIERLGWAAGGDCLVWNAIPGGDDPSSASWAAGDPALTWNLGNGSIAGFSGMTVTLRPFIGFVGGVLFSVEGGNIVVPSAATGGTAAAVNASAQDRWDLLEAVLNTNRASDAYGKQTLQVTVGTPGSGIPVSAPPTATERRMPLHGLGVVAGASAYTKGYDLRGWRGQAARVLSPPITHRWADPVRSLNGQQINQGQSGIASTLNTYLTNDELILPSGSAYTGVAVWSATLMGLRINPFVAKAMHVKLSTEGRGVLGGPAVAGTDYAVNAETAGTPCEVASPSGGGGPRQTISLMYPIAMIPAYNLVSVVSGASRSWNRLRFGVSFSLTEPPADNDQIRIFRQSLMINLWPVV